jgi:hypothetical protein
LLFLAAKWEYNADGSVKTEIIKALYSALLCVFAEAAKRDASAEALVVLLRGKCGVPEAQAGVVGEIYASAKERLRRELRRAGDAQAATCSPRALARALPRSWSSSSCHTGISGRNSSPFLLTVERFVFVFGGVIHTGQT